MNGRLPLFCPEGRKQGTQERSALHLKRAIRAEADDEKPSGTLNPRE
eukprot:jgi/Botrbrau1/16457/Bobra.0142s0053.1